jgi:predicted transcriptional regulator
MTHRTTFALDEETAQRLKRLAKDWKVSQAEVVRRAVLEAERSPRPAPGDAIEALRELHRSGGGLVREVADQYLAEVREDRKRWRSR